MRIDPFGVEQWMNAHEDHCRFNIAETCVDSLTVGGLLELAGRNDDLSALAPTRLGYGAIPGSNRLRDAIAALYRGRSREDVLVAHGTAGANALVWQALAGPGHRVVSLVPTYQQHLSIPESLGAEVVRVPLSAAEGWLPDWDAVARAVTPGTKLVALTNPNNPTSSLIDAEGLSRLVEIARAVGADLLVDEVYRNTAQEGDGATPSIADLYERGIATCGMSKAYSLAGLRLGWIVGPPDVLEAVALHRDYTTISVGVLDDHLAATALEAPERILARTRAITRRNLALIDDWIATEPRVDWVRPRAGTTGLLRYGIEMGSEALCLALLEEEGVLLTPGGVMGAEGYLRIGFGNATEILQAALPRLSAFLARQD
ncbi:aminotransferase class I/II-fold pyridoxal phosphate-dependent enzyme [Jannaschia ovalis]|uniref:Aminotransferase n=1 Tax=Jannaschia ovalis TaxID=3038773 RepID=A0ABY8LBM1_9RHOB|nr:aminotransferase class I/II-fold pyridoxal phosphate-dependent enzyme [Jannaschia sp. GRR-S6-38]WGH78729.1 aminotransferase class I/II-fold pyridoxal phosphate-dependent enzyme [Jannaschia sp. GRR-S6-38]